MTAAQLPPAPWRSDQDDSICEIWDANSVLVAEVSSFIRKEGGDRHSNRPGPDVLALGQAIAAVPDMVAALQAMLVEFGNEFANNPACEQSKAALRKAGQL